MSTELQERVSEQARLLVRFLSSLGADGERSSLLVGETAELAERLFEGLEGLYGVESSSSDSSSGSVAVPRRAAAAIADPAAKRRAYEDLVERIQARIATEVPKGSTIAVISRGDGSLVQLHGSIGWHFPQNEAGLWAGYHPATGRDAVNQLEVLRRKGARYLLIPGTSAWWLQFYDELRHHLDANADVVAADSDMALFRLNDEPHDMASPQSSRYYASLGQFAELAALLLPADSKVLVIARGDDAWLAVDRITTMHFPSAVDGTYQGHPADDEDAIAALDLAVANGAQFLAMPEPFRWWRDVYGGFWRYLYETYSLVADQREVGAFFDLVSPKGG